VNARGLVSYCAGAVVVVDVVKSNPHTENDPAVDSGKFAAGGADRSLQFLRRRASTKLSSRPRPLLSIIEQRKFSTLTIKHFLWRDPSPMWRCEVSMRKKTVCEVETNHQWLILGAVSSAFEQWERAQ